MPWQKVLPHHQHGQKKRGQGFAQHLHRDRFGGQNQSHEPVGLGQREAVGGSGFDKRRTRNMFDVLASSLDEISSQVLEDERVKLANARKVAAKKQRQ